MGFLKDVEVKRAEESLDLRTPPSHLLRWIKALHDDRRARIELALELSRQLRQVRRALQQAFKDLDSLTLGAYKASGKPWAGQLPCPVCGAPSVGLTMDVDGPGGAWAPDKVHHHPDGTVCRIVGKPRD